ncbi:MAG: 1-acyl-sn-glycerol-3-phosphate acyltransferase [Dysgonamonadaceae bacterium]|jgi:1-acyl-sn-glycerol-3-phosphate acyltransferase|nr:1-acyl-sn-glycerol-3-phosphate acyltransferase [Dysgonamonadaceae bacterium]
MATDEIFQINLREILRTKAPQFYKKVPGFAVSLLSKLICENPLNAVLREIAPLTGVSFMEKALHVFNVRIQLHGVENLPAGDQRCIFASNHPLGGMDGICLSAALGKHYDGRIRYLVNDILYFIKPLQDIFVPINKHGSQAKAAVSLLHEAMVSGNQIITFPSGFCSRKTGGVIRDPKWKKMFISKAIEYRRNVVPVYFDAKNSRLFYALANMRTALGMKLNLEMLLLPREMFKKQNTVMNIYFGKPIAWQTFDASKTPQQWAVEIENKIYNTIK